MYSINVVPPDEHSPVINRKMVADSAIQLLPVIVEICKVRYNYDNPVAVYMGNGAYHIFDLNNPEKHAVGTIHDLSD